MLELYLLKRDIEGKMSIIIMILLLSVLILVHEAGHFFAARMFGIKVDKFGFGLPVGPVLFETQCGDTKILVHALLLGGYVSFPDDEKDCELDEDSPDRFMNKPVYQRAIVVSAGVIANVLCAFVFVFLTATVWGHMPSGKYDIYINNIIAPKSESIWQSGIKKDDKLLAINGTKIDTTYALLSFVKLSKAYDGKVNHEDAMKTLSQLKELNPALMKYETIPSGVGVELPNSIMEEPVKINSKVLKGLKQYKNTQIKLTAPQEKLRDSLKGKSFYNSNGKYTLNDLAYAISDSVHPLYVSVERNGKVVNLKPIMVNKKGMLGIQLAAKEILIPTKTPLEILKTGTKYLYDNTYMLLYGLGQIFTGQIPLKDLHGIIAITKVGGDVIQNSGIFSGLLLVAIISMDLAIVNFLPIPALDGGHVMFLIIEKLRGKPLDQEKVEKIANIGFWFLMALMFIVIFNDVIGLITKKF